MRIAVFPGVFNPPHMGHVKIATEALKVLNIDKFIFVPTSSKYIKQDINLVSQADRCNMLKAVFTKKGIKHSKIEVSTVEIEADRQLFTYETLEVISEQYKTNDIIVLMGADNLATFDQWNNYEKIFKEYNLDGQSILAFGRCIDTIDSIINNNSNLERYKNKIRSFDMNIGISSSHIRAELRRGNTEVLELLPPEVSRYITGNKLYGVNDPYRGEKNSDIIKS